MFIWGNGHKTAEVSDRVLTYCDGCGGSCEHTVSVGYDYNHIFWLFKGCKNESTTTQCKTCGMRDTNPGVLLKPDLKDVKNPIPFMDRYGGHVLALAIIAYIAFALTFPCAINPTSQACIDSQLGGN